MEGVGPLMKSNSCRDIYLHAEISQLLMRERECVGNLILGTVLRINENLYEKIKWNHDGGRAGIEWVGRGWGGIEETVQKR